ncbi:PP2C family protein-serine/threonine phosphatase [Candidatus Chloroploca sp. Khr17]|uniref:PP2C family protein-serine/threonine phosphatase n=1 Tax=Candidatus Chloroploca sp. Khr17 TaxID=2496869 RepID=UPI00101CCF34|nr:SpoIIE family protein phosphatase [Candidatus Chloroploca sp. Khr17]
MAAQTILIIDEQAERRNLLRDQLEALGYVVTALDNGRAALDLLKTQRFDLALLELGLWGAINSYQVLERMRATGALMMTPVLMIAPDDLDPGLARCFEMGAVDYIPASCLPPVVKARVQGMLAQRTLLEHQQNDDQQETLLKIERDVQIARQIQLGFLPSQLPQLPGWEIAARFHPAREVAGDFYDAFMLTQNRRVGFVIADVCDKGVGAALFMSLSRSLVRAFAQQHYSLSDWTNVLGGSGDALTPVARREKGRQALPTIGAASLKNAMVLTNNYITDNHLDMNMFVTLFFGVFDPVTGALIYANGGHCPPLIVGPDGVRTKLAMTGPAVGLIPGADFNIAHAQIDPGEILFCYSDGVTDARNPERQFFGEKRLLQLLAQPAASATEVLDRFERNLQAHIASADQFDDITMLAIQRIAA